MNKIKRMQATRLRRQRRVRSSVKGSCDRPRLHVYRSSKHISAQIIDDELGRTLAAASSYEKDVREASGTKSDIASKVGLLVGERALKAGATKVVFDRGPYKFHGRVKALAEAARKSGLEF